MRATWKGPIAVLLLLAIAVCCSCEGSGSTAGGSKGSPAHYSRYNIHYYAKKDANVASYANYTDCPGHGMLPYNTQFKVESVRSGGFKLIALDTGMKIVFEYRAPNMGGMGVREYIDLIMSPVPVSYPDLTAQDQQGIQAGRAMAGMTKQGVMIALGYPAKHRTPSTDLNAWVYWKGRFNTLVVNFGEDGKVASIR
jgi:hypothetical protein